MVSPCTQYNVFDMKVIICLINDDTQYLAKCRAIYGYILWVRSIDNVLTLYSGPCWQRARKPNWNNCIDCHQHIKMWVISRYNFKSKAEKLCAQHLSKIISLIPAKHYIHHYIIQIKRKRISLQPASSIEFEIQSNVMALFITFGWSQGNFVHFTRVTLSWCVKIPSWSVGYTLNQNIEIF